MYINFVHLILTNQNIPLIRWLSVWILWYHVNIKSKDEMNSIFCLQLTFKRSKQPLHNTRCKAQKKITTHISWQQILSSYFLHMWNFCEMVRGNGFWFRLGCQMEIVRLLIASVEVTRKINVYWKSSKT